LSASMLSLAATSAPMGLTAAPLALRSPSRFAAPQMGFGPSPKEMSDDPSIPEALAAAMNERTFRVAFSSGQRFTPGGPELMRDLPGVMSPMGFFDPLGFTPEDRTEALIYREAELTHGRVAMLAAIGYLVQEKFHPIFNEIGGPAIRHLDRVLSTSNGQFVGILVLTTIFFTELTRAKIGWMDPNKAKRTLVSGYRPGDLGFDPLSFAPKTEAERLVMENKELNNGRLAMIGVAGMTAQELVTGTPILA